MRIPHSNLLASALTVISPDPFLLGRVTGRTKSLKGQYVSTYAEPTTEYGSIQAVPRNRYQSLGLDWNKNYIQIYTIQPIQDLNRDTGGDRITYNGRFFDVLSNNDWSVIDGWNGVLAVDVGDAT